MSYQLTTLKNGLRVASETLSSVESVAICLTVGVGARHEQPSENGLSHVLEHMAFKGTKTRNAYQIAEAFDNVGGHFNAFTSMENTVYYAKLLKEDAELGAEILGDIMLNSVFDESELAREKDVIIQEIAMHHDSPEDLIHDCFDACAFPNQPMGRSILGTEKNVSGFTRDQVMGYMKTHYRPRQMVLSIAGNISHENAIALAEKYFAFDASDHVTSPAKAEFKGGANYVDADFEQLHMMMGLPTVTIHSPHYYCLQLYASILGGGMSSRLFQEVREKRGLAYSVGASGSAYEDCGVLTIYAATSEKKAGELSSVLCEELVKMTHAIDEAELTRAKNQAKAELLMARESPQTVAMWMGRHLLRFGEYRQADMIKQRIDAVSIKDMTSLANDLLKGDIAIAALGPTSHVAPYDTLLPRLRMPA